MSKKKDRYHKMAEKRSNRKNIAICDKKIRYSDVYGAIAGGQSTIENVEGIDEMFYYKCRICNGYHISKLKGTNSISCG